MELLKYAQAFLKTLFIIVFDMLINSVNLDQDRQSTHRLEISGAHIEPVDAVCKVDAGK